MKPSRLEHNPLFFYPPLPQPQIAPDPRCALRLVTLLTNVATPVFATFYIDAS